MKCLVVDDSITMRRIMANMVQELGCHEVLEAADGKLALEQLDQSFDLVITDWNMPTLGGVELARQLRARPDTANVRILMATGRNVKEDILAAMEAGIDGYLIKPFTAESLKAKIAELLENQPPKAAVE